jgi:membrane-bound ClpP family serine protease
LAGVCLVLASLVEVEVGAEGAAPEAGVARGDVVAIELRGAIGPAGAAYVERAIADA